MMDMNKRIARKEIGGDVMKKQKEWQKHKQE
jgi:hypothetical protein